MSTDSFTSSFQGFANFWKNHFEGTPLCYCWYFHNAIWIQNLWWKGYLTALLVSTFHLLGIYPNSFTSVDFWTQIEFLNVVKCRWGSRGSLCSATGSWQSCGHGSGGKVPEKVWAFYIWRANKLLKIKEI